MARKARPNRKKRIGRYTAIGIAMLSAVLCFTFTYRTGALKKEAREYLVQIDGLKEEKKKALERKKELEDYEDYVKTDEFVEETAREKLGLVYKNEIIFKPDVKD